jgi:nitrite reductase/ring-hydroxylating ferredoxin subunit
MANTGLALMMAGAYLGGDEVYDIGYGVNHTAFEYPPTKFGPLMPEADLAANKPTKADAQGTPVLLVKLGTQIYALGDTCVHAGCSLAEGKLDGASIICPCHGSQYDLRDGSVINGPATMPEPHYEVRTQNGMIEVKQA